MFKLPLLRVFVTRQNSVLNLLPLQDVIKSYIRKESAFLNMPKQATCNESHDKRKQSRETNTGICFVSKPQSSNAQLTIRSKV